MNVDTRAGNRESMQLHLLLLNHTDLGTRYWQEQLDAGKFKSSVLLDPVYGFGGNGQGSNNCIKDGPFANYTNVIGPGYSNTNHCIDRRLDDTTSRSSSKTEVDKCLASKDWSTVWVCIEGSPHRGGHGGVGGEVHYSTHHLYDLQANEFQMLNGVSSPGDPLFYLHHTWLDKIWADWQNQNRSYRLTEMGGVNVMPKSSEQFFIPRPSNIPRPTGADGDPSTTTTLKHVLNMYGNGPNRTIADVMDTSGDVLCYVYVEP